MLAIAPTTLVLDRAELVALEKFLVSDKARPWHNYLGIDWGRASITACNGPEVVALTATATANTDGSFTLVPRSQLRHIIGAVAKGAKISFTLDPVFGPKYEVLESTWTGTVPLKTGSSESAFRGPVKAWKLIEQIRTDAVTRSPLELPPRAMILLGHVAKTAKPQTDFVLETSSKFCLFTISTAYGNSKFQVITRG